MEIRRRPIQCLKSWSLGHTSHLFWKGDRCKSCALAYDPATPCSGPPQCIKCKSRRHLSDSRSCPAYIQKPKVFEFPQNYGLSFKDANSNLYSSQPPSLGRPLHLPLFTPFLVFLFIRPLWTRRRQNQITNSTTSKPCRQRLLFWRNRSNLPDNILHWNSKAIELNAAEREWVGGDRMVLYHVDT